jgi:EAL domain-containing protein (putative c-di-GMP-specific phosphodiesterase class I)
MLRGMLSTVLELELVTVDFEAIVSLREARVVGWRLARRPQTELLAGLPPTTSERLVALARDEGRAACLERLWQKVSLERVARFGPREPVLASMCTSALDARWSVAALRTFLRAHHVTTPLVLELPEAHARAAAEIRMGGFGVATSGGSWRECKPHWRLVDAPTFLRGEPAQIASETFAFDAQLVVTGVGRGDQLRAIRSAGGDLVSGPAFGRPRVRPDAGVVPAMPLVEGSERRESLAFGRNYEPEGALSV